MALVNTLEQLQESRTERMKKIQIKICGIRRREDCLYINEAMPDYAGFIFWDKSFRNVDMPQAYKLREWIDKRIQTVGVFVNEAPEFIYAIAKTGIVDIVQLHGTESPEYVDYIRQIVPVYTKIWKAYKVRSAEDIEEALKSNADRILLDNGCGTGQCFDQSLLNDERLKERGFILAGGMTPENIPEAVSRFAPDIIDISSGVETDKVKDRYKIIKAVQTVRNCREAI